MRHPLHRPRAICGRGGVGGQGRRRAACGRSGTDGRFGGPAIVGLEVRQTGSFASPPFDGFALGKSASVVFVPWTRAADRVLRHRHGGARARVSPARYASLCALGVRNFRTMEALLGRPRRTARGRASIVKRMSAPAISAHSRPTPTSAAFSSRRSSSGRAGDGQFHAGRRRREARGLAGQSPGRSPFPHRPVLRSSRKAIWRASSTARGSTRAFRSTCAASSTGAPRSSSHGASTNSRSTSSSAPTAIRCCMR